MANENAGARTICDIVSFGNIVRTGYFSDMYVFFCHHMNFASMSHARVTLIIGVGNSDVVVLLCHSYPDAIFQ